MVRFALFIGACALAAQILISTVQLSREVPELAFERDSVIPIATPTSATGSPHKKEEKDDVIETKSPKEIELSLVKEKTVELSPPKVQASSSLPLKQIKEVPRAPSLAPENLNEKTRSALVNILCEASAPLRSTSGSGVIISPRGIILTNAHIAQYFLLEESPFPVSCSIRTGSPATARWRAKLVFIPDVWVDKHGRDILSSRATGTGEHDYALLAVTNSIDDSPLPTSFPFIPMNFQEAASVTGDAVLVAGYPAEFLGGSAARSALHASTVFSTIKQLLTFTESIVDVVSVRGTALAQSGSSGGSFVDLWGSLVGLIVTTTIGDTTDTRDLHAITPAHIDRSVRQNAGISFKTLLDKEKETLVDDFAEKSVNLTKLLQEAIESRRD